MRPADRGTTMKSYHEDTSSREHFEHVETARIAGAGVMGAARGQVSLGQAPIHPGAGRPSGAGWGRAHASSYPFNSKRFRRRCRRLTLDRILDSA